MKHYRGIALCAALALSLSACSTGESGTESNATSAAAASETQMGRWVESEVDLGGREIAGGPTLLDDGSLVLFVCTQDPAGTETGPVYRLTSTDNGETWTEEDSGWGEQVEGCVNQVWMNADGTACVSSVVLDEESRADNTYQIYLQKPGDTLKEMNLEDSQAIRDVVFYQGDILLIRQYYGADGSSCKMTVYDMASGESHTVSLGEDASYGGGVTPVVTGDKLVYLSYQETAMPLMQLNPQDGTSTQIMDNLSEAISPGGLIGDSEGALYYPTEKGIYRLAPGGTLPEQVVSADGTAMSVKSNYPVAICRAGNGDFLVTLLGDDAAQHIYRYHYDETLPTHAETTLNVWSLQESATARGAINLYKQQHPEVDVNFTVAIQDNAQDPTAARNDALTQLNTELLAGEGPDLLILDGVAYETYAEKGLLADLSAVLPLEVLQKNLTDPFIQDGKVYVMPARFTLPVLIGDDGTLDGLTDLSALQQAVLDAAPFTEAEGLSDDQKYALWLTSSEAFADFLLPVTADAILQNDTLNEEALRQVMTFVQDVSQYYDVKNAPFDSMWGSVQSWSGTDVITVNGEQSEYSDAGNAKYGWFNMDTPFSLLTIARRESATDFNSSRVPCDMVLRPGLTAGAYIPGVLVGVNANSAHLEAANELAATFFDTSVQGNYYSDGMTVRADCLSEKMDDVLNCEQYEADLVKCDIKQLVNSCTTPVLVPAVLRDSFVKHTDAIIQGQETADDAVKGIQSDISLYLAEQQ